MSRRLLTLAVGLAVCGPSVAVAATINVTIFTDTVADDGACSLREAVTAAFTDAASGATGGECVAGEAGVDDIQLGSGTYLVSGAIDDVGGFNLLGAGVGDTIIDFQSSGKFDLNSAAVGFFDLTVKNGSGAPGGCLFVFVQNTTVERCAFEDCDSSGKGGAIAQAGGKLTVTDSRFVGNLADVGGAINIEFGGTTLIQRSRFTGNLALTAGGAINRGGQNVTIDACTFDENTSTDGGAIASSGGTTITGCTFTLNEADNGGAINASGNVTLAGNVLDLNDGTVTGVEAVGAFTSLGGNIVVDGTGTTGIDHATDQVGTTTAPLDIKMGGLAGNGGPTDTIAPLAASLALGAWTTCDAGLKDQRGEDRAAGACTAGAYEVVCGDDHEAGDEECDDGNTTSFDGCSSTCELHICGDGILDADEVCDDGTALDGTGCKGDCSAVEFGFECLLEGEPCESTCGDGKQASNEGCDDVVGIPLSGDGCSDGCVLEVGFDCTGNFPTTCTATCGDGLVKGDETCDDVVGIPQNGDGCSDGCVEEFGYECTGEPSACATDCGDGKQAGDEVCDDGDTNGGNGCSAGCDQIEFGFTCTGTDPTVCSTECGDGKKAATEGCDDDNLKDGDGCSGLCGTEFGFDCTGTQPSECESTCGDGKQASDEQCDDIDGAPANGDGCSDACLLEAGFTCAGLQPSNCTGTCGTAFSFANGLQEWDTNDGFGLDGATLKTTLTTGVPTSTRHRFAIPAAVAASPVVTVIIEATLSTNVCLGALVNDSGDVEIGGSETCDSGPQTLTLDVTTEAGTTKFLVLDVHLVAGGGGTENVAITSVIVGADADDDGLLEFAGQAGCDGCIDVDVDGYGHLDSDTPGECTKGAGDCEDGNAGVNPGVTELCTGDVDDNCNGATDTDDGQCFEDCANGEDDGTDGGNGLSDCDDAICATDPFCANKCNDDYRFTAGGGDWTATNGLFEATEANGDGVWTTSKSGLLDGTSAHLGRLQLDYTVPAVAVGGPKPQLEVVYVLEGEANPSFDKFAVCINDTDCIGNTPGNAFVTGVNTKSGQAPGGGAPNYNDGVFDHIFVDLSPYVGQAITITLVYDSVDAGSPQDTAGLTITQVVLGSNVDADGLYEGTDDSCDQCWDGDFDQYGHENSPDLNSCPKGPAFDCDDTKTGTNPGALELCTEPGDEDCNGKADALDFDACGFEDCANNVDDNSDSKIDCADPSCVSDAACAVCSLGYSFDKGGSAWLASDNDPDGQPATRVWQQGLSTADNAKGWATVLDGTVASANTEGKGFVKAHLVRTVAVPAGQPKPQLVLEYSLDSDAAETTDVFGVCFNVVPTQCNAGSAANVLVWKSGASTAGLVTKAIDLPPGSAGQNVDVVLMYDTVDNNSNDNAGVFVNAVSIRSDIDGDGLAEAPDPSCDHCVDIDGDDFGNESVPADFVSACANPELDCLDTDEFTKPNQGEDCDKPGDQNCNDLLDDDEVSCSECGDNAVTAGEQCDDGAQTAGDGCDATCQLEVGALHITEIHLSKLAGLAGEQWFEIYNRSAATLDLTGLNLKFKNQTGLQQDFSSECAPRPNKTTSIGPNSFYVIALGAAADGLDADAACSGFFQLNPNGDNLGLLAGGDVVDAVDFTGFACELASDTPKVDGIDRARSFELDDAINQTNSTNDSAGVWCLATASNSYSTSTNHYGSPGSAGTCTELACDAADDDCDGQVDEGLPDNDIDGVCNEQDCDPEVKTCTSLTECAVVPDGNGGCELSANDADGDCVADCKDGCIDQDGDGWGVAGGAAVTTCLTDNGVPKEDCEDTLSFVHPTADESGAACTNLVDDNCDKKLDCTDDGCVGSGACEGEACDDAVAVECGELNVVEPITNAFPCGAGADAVLSFTPTVSETITIRVGNEGQKQYAANVFAGSCTNNSCNAPAVTVGSLCTADGDETLAVTAGTTYYVVVDQIGDCAGSGSNEGTVVIACGEICTGGDDEDGDGDADCADSDCVTDVACLALDFDQDGVSNGDEITCGTDPADGLKTPTTDDLLNVDNDVDGQGAPKLNCIDDDDDGDGQTDADEAVACALNATAKNDATIHTGAAKNCDKAGIDADCNGKLDTEESDCGAKEQQCGDGKDNDLDAKIDCADTDCVPTLLCSDLDFDVDGVTNGVEVFCNTDPINKNSTPGPAAAGDVDGDGLPNCADDDDDGDGVPDLEEILCGSDPNDKLSVPLNTDGDLQCDAVDPDDDNDSFADEAETDCNSDPLDANSTPKDLVNDLDQDGICNAKDPDIDGDGWNNGVEDACGTNALVKEHNPTDLGLDGDNDKVCDALDNDDDNDGWTDDKEALCLTDKNDANSVPADLDGDGKCDILDDDADQDGWPDATEDACGTDKQDKDSNPTALGQDQDGDKLCNAQDDDDDGDGWSDTQETECGSDKNDPDVTPIDTDDDKLCNAKDDDDDGDGWKDSAEIQCNTDPLDPNDTPVDTDGNGVCDTLDATADPDNDQWINKDEDACGTDKFDGTSIPVDTDDNGICDALDPDDDGDGWNDVTEKSCGSDPLIAALHPVDTDGDGTCDAIDTDDDGDGSPDADEILCGTDTLDKASKPTEEDVQDFDKDGEANCIDTDDDGDLVSDEAEAMLGSNRLNKDSDGDGLEDGVEDADQSGTVDAGETSPTDKDSDDDGLEDGVEADSCYDQEGDDCLTTKGYEADSDSDGLMDGAEDKNKNGLVDAGETNPLIADSDGDGQLDGEEVSCASDPLDMDDVWLDLDGSGVCDGAEKDSDNDGVPDGVESFCGTDPQDNKSTPSLLDLIDLDEDGDINCVDTDDDQDDFSDEQELECKTSPVDAEDKPSLDQVGDNDGDGALNCSDPDDDNDKLADVDEEAAGGDPFDADTDDDGIADGQEAQVHKTAVDNADTDGDGVQDGTELGYTKGVGADTGEAFIPDADPSTVTDPKKADSDGDGVVDGEEDANANGRVDPGEGDPNSPKDGNFDTDGDGLTDREELTPKVFADCPNLIGDLLMPTDPENPDTDGDGLSDELELRVHCTNANDPDTDDGGVIDGIEVANGTNPLDATDDFAHAILAGDNVFGCAAEPTSRAPLGTAVLLLAMFFLLAFWRRQGRALAIGLLAASLLVVVPMEAQSQARSHVGNVNIENFYPVGGRHRVWSVEASQVGPKWEPYAHLYFHGERQSLKILNGDHQEVLIDSATFMDVNIGVGLFDFMQFEVGIPVAIQMESGADTQAIAPVSGAGMGDMLIRLRGSLLDNKTGGFGIGLTLGATFPTGSGEHFRGDEGVGVIVNSIFDYKTSRVVVAINWGVRLRTAEAEFLNVTFSHELTYGMGISVEAWRGHINIGGEIFGRTPLAEAFGSLEQTSLEFLMGPKWEMFKGLSLHAAVGAGLVQGFGTPDFRFVTGVQWAPKRTDTDGDGVPDDDDQCPLDVEDKDGWADADGCPDLDNDNDGILDVDDQCPNASEDINGISDDDGCPDGDEDGDGVADAQDRCPGDKEDMDGWQDDDGCPEADNDLDGILDADDKCPDQAETPNGFEDKDGCPDKAPGGAVMPLQKVDPECAWTVGIAVPFDKGSVTLSADGKTAIKAVAAKLKGNALVVEVAVDGHASEEGANVDNLSLSRKRARAVRDELVKRGVKRSLLAARGFGEARPAAGGTDASVTTNRRVDFRAALGGKCKQAKVPDAHKVD